MAACEGIAEMASETRVARAFFNECRSKHLDRELTVVDAAMVKWWCTEIQKEIIGRSLGL